MATVLVVEDEATVLMLAESILQDAGYDILSASSVAEAESILQADKRIDLVFTDIELRDQAEGGLHLGQMVQRTRKGVPMLYSSGRTLTDGMKELFAEGSAFLPKPYTNQELLDAVGQLLPA